MAKINTKTPYRMYKDINNAEERLLEIFNASDRENKIKEALESKEWELIYHLEDARKNVIRWKDFGENNNILEIGAGTGIITEELCSKNSNNSIYALELSPARAEVIKARCSNYSNLEIITDNLEDFSKKTELKFDYIVVIGVLEYSGRYIDSEKPYIKFLEDCKSLLNDKGTIILAIENKFGIKYWAGSPEDHLGLTFEGIEGYPNNHIKELSGIETFTKKELSELFVLSGLKIDRFLYPLPSYKFPMEIFSDEYKPSGKSNIVFSRGTLKNRYGEEVGKHIFDIELVMNQIINNDLFCEFANSFIISASK